MILKFIKNNNRQLFLFWLVLGLTMFLMPLSGHEAGFTWSDKIIHASYFFLMFIVSALTFSVKKYKIWLWLIFYILAVEVVQHFFIPGRGYQIGDVVAGVVGLVIAGVVLKIEEIKR